VSGTQGAAIAHGRQAIAAGRLAAAAARDDRTADVIRLLAKPSLTPTELGVMLELIEDVSGGALRRYAAHTELKRFDRSINHRKVFGIEARHGKSPAVPPPNPMSRKEADEFARGVARRWLDELSK
jgi:hypothetical protein